MKKEMEETIEEMKKKIQKVTLQLIFKLAQKD